MKKRLAVLLTILVLLCGCTPRRSTQLVPDMPSVEDPAPTPAPTQEVPSFQQEELRYGSVALLEEPERTVCKINIYGQGLYAASLNHCSILRSDRFSDFID